MSWFLLEVSYFITIYMTVRISMVYSSLSLAIMNVLDNKMDTFPYT